MRVRGPARLRPRVLQERGPGPGLAGAQQGSVPGASAPFPCSLALLELSGSLAPRGAWDSSLTPGRGTRAPSCPSQSTFRGPVSSPGERHQSRRPARFSPSQVREACRAGEGPVRRTGHGGPPRISPGPAPGQQVEDGERGAVTAPPPARPGDRAPQGCRAGT